MFCRILQLKWVLLLICTIILINSVNGALISGREPTSGKNQLIFDNSKGDYDALIDIYEGNWPSPMLSALIQKGDIYTLDKIKNGDYYIGYIFGTEWDSEKEEFSNEIGVEDVYSYIRLEPEQYNTKQKMDITYKIATINLINQTNLSNEFEYAPIMSEFTENVVSEEYNAGCGCLR